MLFSVIIPTRNRPEMLDRCLTALDGQTFADAVPRLEFWCNGVRRGSLTQAGLIAALGFSDADAPADSTALRFKDNEGRLLFTMGAQMFAPAFSDALP